MLRIGTIDNLSARPYVLCPPPEGAVLSALSPAMLGRRVLEGQFDAALVPSALLPAVGAFMEPAGPYGIACTGAVGSVLLVGRRPLREILDRCGSVYLTPDSRTSRMLFHVLCASDLCGRPRLTDEAHAAEACLYIGDEAVRRRRDADSQVAAVDLSAWWHAHTGHPFVFARWMIRRSVSVEVRGTLRKWLGANAEAAAGEAGRRRLAAERARLFGQVAAARTYYENLRQCLTAQDEEGLAHFLRQTREYGLWSKSA